MLIKKAEYIISAVEPAQYPKLNYPEFVFIGRSNVGKSSFINALVNRKNLARTSSQPGKTQTLNFYNINDKIMFIDVPGYGYAKTVDNERIKYGKMIETYLRTSSNLKVCFLIVDIRHEPSEDDILMYNFLKHFNKKVVIIATKADKIGKTLIYRHLQVIKTAFARENNNIENNLFISVSAEKMTGLDEVWNIIMSEV